MLLNSGEVFTASALFSSKSNILLLLEVSVAMKLAGKTLLIRYVEFVGSRFVQLGSDSTQKPMSFSALVLFVQPAKALRFHCDGDFICEIWHWNPTEQGALVLEQIPITHGAIELHNFLATEISSNLFAHFEAQRRNILEMHTTITVIGSTLRGFVVEDNATYYNVCLEKTQLNHISLTSLGDPAQRTSNVWT